MSGIYIPGMEMPKSCGYCLFWEPGKYRFADCLAADEAVMCRYDDERPPECPLVPVPAHGRLIDADEMFVEFVAEGQHSKRYKLGEKWELNGVEIREVISRLPTIIPADPAEEGET